MKNSAPNTIQWDPPVLSLPLTALRSMYTAVTTAGRFTSIKKKPIKEIKSGKDVEREPVYSYKAKCRKSAKDDIGDSYVEVSISNQEVWLYVNGECKVNSSVVTGDPTK